MNFFMSAPSISCVLAPSSVSLIEVISCDVIK